MLTELTLISLIIWQFCLNLEGCHKLVPKTLGLVPEGPRAQGPKALGPHGGQGALRALGP